jgi:hypothetical protein
MLWPVTSLQLWAPAAPLQLLLPEVSHDAQSEKHMTPSPRGSAFCWYDVGHVQVKLTPLLWLVARPPMQKAVLLSQRVPELLQPLGASLSHIVWLL